MSQKLSVNGFKWVEYIFEFNEGFIKSSNKKCKEEYFLEDDSQYRANLHNDQSELPTWIKIEKVEKITANLHDKH